MDDKLRRRLLPVACVLAYLVVGALYVEAVPPWEAPDEPWHLAYAEAVADGRLPTDAETYEAHQPPLYYAWVALGLRAMNVREVPRALDNPWYPYAVAALWHEPGDQSVPLMAALRGFSALLGCLTVVLAWAATRAAGGGRRAPLLAALVVGLVPQHLFISHAVTNDTLAAAVGALATYGLIAWVARAGETRRSSTVLAVAAALAVLTKLNVLVLLTATLPAAAIVWRRDRRERGGSPSTASSWPGGQVLVPVLAVLVGAAGAAACLALLAPDAASAMAGQAASRGLAVDPAVARPDVIARLLVGTLVSLWARFGWLSVDLPPLLTAIAAGGAALGLAGAVAAALRSRGRRRRAITMAGAVVLIAVLAAARSSLVDPQPQGRLLMPALSALSLLLALGWTTLVPARRQTALVAVVASFLAAANLVAVAWAIPRAMASAHGPMPPVDLRHMPPQRVVAADLTAEHPAASQTFAVGGPGLRRIEVPVAGVSGDGALRLSLIDADGELVGESSVPLTDVRSNRWVGLDVGPLGDSSGETYTLTLDLDSKTPGARVRLWGAPGDTYGGGRLVTAEHGDAGTDLLVLTLLDDKTGR